MKSLLLAVFLVALPLTATAQSIFPIVQDRHMHSSIDLLDPAQADAQSATAPDMDLWVEGVEVAFAETYHFELTASATQYSEIGPSMLSAYGTAVFDAVLNPPEVEGRARMESSCRVQFAVAEPVTFDIGGFISAVAGAAGFPCCEWTVEPSVSVRLDQVAGPVILDEQLIFVFGEWVQEAELADSLPLDVHGELAPGVYELHVTAAVSLPSFLLDGGLEPPTAVYGEAGYVVDVLFAPAGPDPACAGMDANEDGHVDLADYAVFQECFSGPGN